MLIIVIFFYDFSERRYSMNLGDKLIKLRKENKISQEEFAEKLGVSRQTVSNWENYKNYPDISTIVKISELYNISLDILLKGDLEMINNLDTKIKNSKKYKNILLVIGICLLIILGSFFLYTVKYTSTKKKLESNFSRVLKANNFKKNNDGYYFTKYQEKIIFGVPNQKMPGLLDFSLHFHNMVLYCDVYYEDGRHLEGIWNDYDDYNFTIEKDEMIIGSSASIKKKNDIAKLSDELKIERQDLEEIITKGNQLYKEFYKN